MNIYHQFTTRGSESKMIFGLPQLISPCFRFLRKVDSLLKHRYQSLELLQQELGTAVSAKLLRVETLRAITAGEGGYRKWRAVERHFETLRAATSEARGCHIWGAIERSFETLRAVASGTWGCRVRGAIERSFVAIFKADQKCLLAHTTLYLCQF